jgi:hypothetical protein
MTHSAELRQTVTSATLLELLDGSVALIDGEDLGRVSGYEWRLPASHRSRVPVGTHCRPDDLCELVFLDRLITNAGPDDIVLHRNRDTLDNRRENLVVIARQSAPLALPAESIELWAD